MLTLNDGRKELYQWDTGRIATVDVECEVVHFSNLKYGESLAVEVKYGEVAIPNKLLMSGAQIYCWAFANDDSGAYTKNEQTLVVIKRPKPSDYVYTETEVLAVETAVNNALEKAKESGEFKGDKGDKGEQGIPGLKGDKGDKGADGYTPQKGIDYFTPEDIAELNIPSVDQTYTPESENAQSGKAVKEAVLPKLNKPENAPQIGDTLRVTSVNTDGTFACEWTEVTSGSESLGKLIGEIELEENARIVEFTQCQDGSPLNFSEVIICIRGSSDANGRNICFDVNHIHGAQAYNWTMNTGAQMSITNQCLTIHAKIIGGWMFLGETHKSDIYNTSIQNGYQNRKASADKREKITESIVIGIGWGYMAAGTFIQVWGR